MNKIYAFFKDAYFGVKNTRHIVVPMDADIKNNSINYMIHDNLDQAEINIYNYHSDLVTDVNRNRVAFMKDYLISEKITEILEANEDYVVAIEYELYNNDGKLIKTSTTSVKAKYCKAIINDDINEENGLEYREGFVFDGRIEINIPQIAKYGIKNAYVQHPYTVRIKKIGVYTTIGETGYIKEADSQVEYPGGGVTGSSMNYFCHKPDDLCFNNFASHFLTNARVGTSIIDSTVVSKVLDTEEPYVIIPIVEIPCNGNEYTVKINHKLNLITVNLEVLVDNFLEVFSKEDIDEILLHNKENENDDESESEDMFDTDGDECECPEINE